ncbi:glycogen biosynthesis protein [Streptococcus pseudoporcinus]|uniref:Glycogen biosynthesis protein n=1 Tax=Streptococcus pseudoporcinus TaxID=361101 RepID=A0A4V6KZP3_9STRE|nr:glucose-1-phosphate adenylyltransferase subunit GlgD [Streptococcus pseudoporcinus]VTS13557.1 glycogen biosynthesis protein [Streptococcus pseudoporcinus]VTS20500.1 glycogen biosynthesis protein [Streptococcus pseudoporcinus]VUC66629.1 glycogen biosynthesis protein [Streptococcus pseudoporcinus]VUC97557.1 glycogen biosynthesis protein [Streptococcus pseudoporcinus]VUC97949.1 glycogen biosynthesis protein [Streptococcus pseudoporcinus]
MKSDKYSAILGSAIGFPEMGGLTDKRPLANLPFDGKYRLIDFHLSNLANAGVKSIYGIFRAENIRSVFDHIRSGREWGLNSLLSHYFLGFYNTKEDSKETDANYYEQILTYLRRSGSDQTIYMSCDILCNIELEQVIHLHKANKRHMTVVYKKMPLASISSENDILEIDETDTVIGRSSISEKEGIEKMSAGIYIVNTDWLIREMEKEAQREKPQKLRFLLRDLTVNEGALAFEYTGYMANIHSIKSYYDANMDMLDPLKFYSLLYSNQKVYTRVKNEEATYFAEESEVNNSQFASGSVIKGTVNHSIISRNCYLESDSYINHSIISPKVTIGKGSSVEYAIVDKSVTIAPGLLIRGKASDPIVVAKGSQVTEDMIK